MVKRWMLLAYVVVSLAVIAAADEGMWLFNHPPADKIKASYGFTLTPAWLEHLQKSSVRFNNGGSGSFVSADGLTFTNHHVAQTCLHGISTAEKDLYKTGFYAKSYAEEPKCPDIELNVLMGIEDVSDKINAAVKPGMNAAAAGTAQRTAMTQLEADCAKSSGLRCDVVPFYASSVFHLYKYKKYTDVRLVFAPEFDIAFFGGDPDNFEFPRYDLDIAFFRVYENDKPVKLEHYLKWSTGALKDGDLVFVSGHPGSTGRLLTMAQLFFLRDVSLPLDLEMMTRRDNVLKVWGAKSPENYRRAQETIFSIENNLKRTKVYKSSLFDKKIMDKKQAEETALQQSVGNDPKKIEEFGTPWADVEQALKTEREFYLPFTLFERRAAFRGDLAGFARALVRVATEKPKPNSERLREYRDTALPALEQTLFASTPVYKDMEEVQLADSLAMLQEKLPQHPLTKETLNGRTPAVAAHEIIANTRLDDVAFRKQLYAGGWKAIAASEDPLIVVMREIDGIARQLRTQYDDEVDAVERLAGAKIGKLRFAKDGYNVAPDATFTLRLSYGSVRGYVEDGLGDVVPKGTKIAPFTVIGGAFKRADKMGNKDPFRLPQTWLDARKVTSLKVDRMGGAFDRADNLGDKDLESRATASPFRQPPTSLDAQRIQVLKLDTPFNFVSTADIIGGNSGSPVVNTANKVVGIIFDGNMQSLPGRYVFDDTANRAVSVDSRGIMEVLRNVYHAPRVADELSGKPSASGK